MTNPLAAAGKVQNCFARYSLRIYLAMNKQRILSRLLALFVLLAASLRLSAGNATYNSAVSADSPIAFWSFDETTGTTAADSAGVAQNGIYENCTLGLTSAFPNLGTCALFNGTNSRVRMPANAAFELGTGDFSVELWYQTTTTARGDMFNFKNAIDFGIFANNAGVGDIGGWHNGGLPNFNTTTNAWHHVVYVRQANTITLYVDGVARSSAADAVSMSANTDIIIGANINAIWFTGNIDEVAYYGSALSAGRVSAHYAAATTTNPNAPLVQTGTASGITSSGATIGGSFLQVGSPDPTVTMYYGLTNGGSVPANWSNNVVLGTRNSAFTTNVTGLTAATQYYFIARAQNASGDSYGLPAGTFTTANGAPTVANIAATNVVASGATIGGQIVATGGLTPNLTLYYGPTDGGTTPGSWASSVNLGAVATSATTTLTGLTINTQYFFRAFATHAGGSAWAPSSATFTTPNATPPALTTDAATDVNGFSATMRGTVTSIGNDPPLVKFFYGTTDGGNVAGSWTSNITLPGTQTAAFAKALSGLAANTTYFYRAQATNAAGTVWASSSQTFTTTAATTRTVVINEIHYHPVELPAFDVNGVPNLDLTEEQHEFIEIKNVTASPITLTGWKFTAGVEYAFTAGTTIPAGGYLVIAKNPTRLQTVYAGLTGVLGPFTGTLTNSGDTITLKDQSNAVVDTVKYDREFPWPNSPDALGGGDDFTLLNSASYQYKGRSLQRVSADAEANDPANWLASPLGSAPTPGAANAVSLAVPKPVLVASSAVQASDDSATIRATQAVRVTAQFSTTAGLTSPQVEYFIDAIDGANAHSEPRATVAMTALGNNQFTATIPGQADRSVVRWRVKANRGDGVEQVYPRTDDAAIVPVGLTAREAWAAYFVQPVRTTTKVFLYDVFISNSDSTNGAFNGLNGLAALNYNITGNPKRVTDGSNNGLPRDIPYVAPTAQIWNGSVPCIHVYNGVVRDAQIRYHGSRYNRSAARQSYKMRFSDTQLIDGADSFFITDKSDYFSVAQGLYINANLPMSEINWVDWYLNGNGAQVRLQQGEYNGDLLDKYHERISDLNPGIPKEKNGELYKSTGTIEDNGEGPYGHGSERKLLAAGVWTALQRYEWTYALQNNGWKGPKPIKDFIEGMWTARGDTHTAPAPNISALRAYLDANLDVDTTLHSLAVLNWMCPWDNTTQNHFLWKRANGRWSHVAWDFDGMFGNGDTTSSNSWIYLGENGTPSPASNTLGAVLGNNFRGPNWFEDSIFKAYRTEYNNKLWILNNTFYTVANLQSLTYRNQNGGNASYYSFINGVKANFCEQRFQSVNIQTGHAADGSDFFRPTLPTLTAPVGGVTALPPTAFTASAYTHTSGSTAGGNAHAKSKWEIRSSTGTYFAPVYVTTSTTSLTSLAIPFSELTFGETYFWRVTYIDASEHPSFPSAESSFVFGAQPTNQTFIAFNASWKYNHTTAFANNSWTLPAFDDSTWTTGNGVFIQNGEPVPTPGTAGAILPAPGTLTPAYRSYNFRKTFTISTNPLTISNLRIRHLIDDGCVIWINGNKVHRYFFNEQANYTTAELTSGGGGPGDAVLQNADAITNTVNWAWVDPRPFLVQGVNTIAVEVHQVSNTSSDVMMGLELTGTIPANGNEVTINEIIANPANGGTDVIELKNVTGAAINIAGWGLSDDLLNPSRYVFPAGTSIPAGGYLLVYCDALVTLPTDLHTGFGLDSGGQRLILTNAGAIKDYVAFGPQARGLSLGRIADGTGAFTLCTPTLGATNGAVLSLGSTANLRMNEWMAQPAHGDDWFEIYNNDSLPVDISGLWLSDLPGTPKITQIPPFSYIAAKGFADFQADGQNDGGNHANFKLSAGGDNLVLSNTAGTATLDTLAITSGGSNISRGRFPNGSATIANFPFTDSRGESNWLQTPVVINEALTNSVLPLTDEIELYNPTATAVDISGWWLSDDASAPQKYAFPNGSTIAAGGFLTVNESQFNVGVDAFSLHSLGEEVVLTATTGGVPTGYRARVSFGAAADNVPFGRVLTGSPLGSYQAEFWPLVSRTPVAANSASIVTPVIINEIHYHPTDLAGPVDNTRDEFVELHNPTTNPVDLSGWKLKGASDFIFPNGSTLRAGDYIVVVGFNPVTDTASLSAFRSATGMSASVPVFGPFTPKLPNDGGEVEIARPVAAGTVFVNVDKVDYTDFAPWPLAPDGTGPSVQRISRTVIGNDPANWASATATPGAVNTGESVIADNDGDGMPNTYEDANGLNKFVNDANGDNDGDGQSNLAEYLAGTSPTNAADRFLITSVAPASGGPGFVITFPAKAGKTYTIQYKNALTDPTWSSLTNIPAVGADAASQYTDPTAQPTRFYRIVTPQQ